MTVDALAAASKIGVVTIDMNGTACKVPAAQECIEKAKGRKKKKTVKC